MVSRTLATYLQLLEGEGEGSHPPLDLLQLTTSWSCLICLSTVRRVDAVWNCDQCGCMLHLVCVQQWAKDSLALPLSPSALSPDLFPNMAATRTWSCPKCRKDYIHSQVPTLYYCFCRKKVCECVCVRVCAYCLRNYYYVVLPQVNPDPDPWLLPHSCGEICSKLLPSNCGHHCSSLCHPGQNKLLV